MKTLYALIRMLWNWSMIPKTDTDVNSKHESVANHTAGFDNGQQSKVNEWYEDIVLVTLDSTRE